MNTTTRSRSFRTAVRATALAVTAAAAALALTAPQARAQQVPASPAGASGGAPSQRNERMKPVADIVRGISRATGLNVVADSSVASRLAPVPAEPTTLQNYEQQIAALVSSLWQGVTWAKLHLPAPANGRAYSGDDVSAYAMAQAKLLGRVGDAPAGQVEILGQMVPA